MRFVAIFLAFFGVSHAFFLPNLGNLFGLGLCGGGCNSAPFTMYGCTAPQAPRLAAPCGGYGFGCGTAQYQNYARAPAYAPVPAPVYAPVPAPAFAPAQYYPQRSVYQPQGYASAPVSSSAPIRLPYSQQVFSQPQVQYSIPAPAAAPASVQSSYVTLDEPAARRVVVHSHDVPYPASVPAPAPAPAPAPIVDEVTVERIHSGPEPEQPIPAEFSQPSPVPVEEHALEPVVDTVAARFELPPSPPAPAQIVDIAQVNSAPQEPVTPREPVPAPVLVETVPEQPVSVGEEIVFVEPTPPQPAPAEIEREQPDPVETMVHVIPEAAPIAVIEKIAEKHLPVMPIPSQSHIQPLSGAPEERNVVTAPVNVETPSVEPSPAGQSVYPDPPHQAIDLEQFNPVIPVESVPSSPAPVVPLEAAQTSASVTPEATEELVPVISVDVGPLPTEPAPVASLEPATVTVEEGPEPRKPAPIDQPAAAPLQPVVPRGSAPLQPVAQNYSDETVEFSGEEPPPTAQKQPEIPVVIISTAEVFKDSENLKTPTLAPVEQTEDQQGYRKAKIVV